MEFTEFTPPEEKEVKPVEGPSKAALIMQIEADYFAEQNGENREEELAKLDERHEAVLAASDDAAARDAYFGHLAV